MKTLFNSLFIALLTSPLSLLAQTQTIPTNIPQTTNLQLTATPIPRVPLASAEEDIQPPTDGPAGDGMGLIPVSNPTTSPNETSTPVNFETMQSTLTALAANTTPITANSPVITSALQQPTAIPSAINSPIISIEVPKK